VHRCVASFLLSLDLKKAPRVVRESSPNAPFELLQAKTASVNQVSTDL
jgi:hypothetical protein